ncbi:MAG TPA: methyltransferase domain-containing protein [Albitalea sp.]|nr:methyltransferase domain-containing protein [Albitalea sp.]
MPPSGKRAIEAPPRLATFDSTNLEKLNAMLPWSSYGHVGGERVLGSAWSARKRSQPEAFPDALVERLAERLPLVGKDVLEMGCFEGHHSITLARHARTVWAIDGRVENVVKTLVRVWVAGCSDKVEVNLLDLEVGTLRQQLESLGRQAPFDVVHHRGVLYHLSDPVGHLVQCAEVCTGSIYIHSQLAHDEQATEALRWGDRSYAAYRYKEPKVAFAPFSGITPHAHWMTESSLSTLLKDLGFGSIDIMNRIDERNGRRVELIASR